MDDQDVIDNDASMILIVVVFVGLVGFALGLALGLNL